MQRTLLPIIAGCAAAVFFAMPKPASATTAATPAIHYGETTAGMVQQVGRRYWRGRRYYGPYAYGYGTATGPTIGPTATTLGLMPITALPTVTTVGRMVIGVVLA